LLSYANKIHSSFLKKQLRLHTVYVAIVWSTPRAAVYSWKISGTAVSNPEHLCSCYVASVHSAVWTTTWLQTVVGIVVWI